MCLFEQQNCQDWRSAISKNVRRCQKTEPKLQKFYDSFIKTNTGIIYCLVVDSNGYAPAHNSNFSKPPTGDVDHDTRLSRHKRIFDDPVGIKLARNTETCLFQTYMQDTGAVLNDLSMPVFIKGKHWGAVRIGFKTDLLTS